MIGKTRKIINVTIKLYSGIEKELTMENYDPSSGVILEFNSRIRLKKVLQKLGLSNLSTNAYFRNGERIGLWTKLDDGDEVSCLKPSGGG